MSIFTLRMSNKAMSDLFFTFFYSIDRIQCYANATFCLEEILNIKLRKKEVINKYLIYNLRYN